MKTHILTPWLLAVLVVLVAFPSRTLAYEVEEVIDPIGHTEECSREAGLVASTPEETTTQCDGGSAWYTITCNNYNKFIVTDSYFYEMLVQNGPNHYECADRTV
ncbi:hypothetical protein PCANC_17374 [Puccinia coronata f. sp. avenae]|uniref:Wall-associated receptor kinase galacturonan-binding domain-containing protein n=1 Tax=Puccinia coronata f. sp. avenae TaxID=200324 RepID=A0A2N5TJW4_9BASI|nr:hypothetical protein PCASD_22676 [Puccinia coronata f. sp. avenae]PLW43285.1 hypothetical protein PCANC_17374 [Puccinia coronata f. sp. avenae]